LAAILFPVFAKAREKARQSSCLSNVKQLAIAAMSYAQDYDEIFAAYGRPWVGTDAVTGYACNYMSYITMLQPYIKSQQIAICPSLRRGATNTNCCTRQSVTYSYAPNHTYFTGENSVANGIAMSSFVVPATTIMIGEVSATQDGCAGEFIIGASGWPAPTPADWGGGSLSAAIHNDGSNYAFYDGHAKWLKQPQYRNWSMNEH